MTIIYKRIYEEYKSKTNRFCFLLVFQSMIHDSEAADLYYHD
jgi:hypothetical protein